ncbi:MAG TPA: hypothetical protein VF574_14590 [Allosphingosinicella sp.]|jgi:uncharacterized protein (TIGR02646 family)
MRARPRGPRPPELDGIKDGETELARATRHFLTDGKVDGFAFAAYSNVGVKKALELMYRGKCAYCEELYDATQPQDVEHYRPKGRVDTAGGKLKPGYWWLAADWDNLLPSCIHCNREQNQILYDGSTLKTGKGDRFPLADEVRRARQPGEEAAETALLLNPCEDDPMEYIRFVEKDGRCIVEPIDPDPSSLRGRRARTSIEIYGLNRATLVKDRSRYMTRLKLSLAMLEILAEQLDVAQGGEADRIAQLAQMEIAGIRTHADGEDRFSGMARTLIDPVFERLGLNI